MHSISVTRRVTRAVTKKLNRKRQRSLVWGFEVCSHVLNFIVIGQHTINIPENLQVFTVFGV